MRVFAVVAILALAVGITLTSSHKLFDDRPIQIRTDVIDDTPLHVHLRVDHGRLPDAPVE